MAPHSSTLAWKIPWMEEPGRLQSMGSLRVGHDWVTSLSLFTSMQWRRKWQPTPVFLPGESQGWGSLVGCQTSLGLHKVRHYWSDLAAAAALLCWAVLVTTGWLLAMLSITRHLSCFHVFSVVNNVPQWTLGCMYPFKPWFSLDICPGMEFLDHRVALVLVFCGSSILFLIVAASIYILNHSVRVFLFLHTGSSIYYL